MTDLNHQTVRLSPGRHVRPGEGVCVMELSSMLVGEPFTDRPRSVCPIIGAFLRRYNDGIDDASRNDLYRFASDAIGTRDEALLQVRADLCRWFIHHQHRNLSRGVWRLVPAGWRTLGAGFGTPPIGAAAGTLAAEFVRKQRPGAHAAALAFVDLLIECSASGETPAAASARAPCAKLTSFSVPYTSVRPTAPRA